ncbi:tripartite motif-containing protein 16-like isoform X2 [Erpetoichthys calabaricus]|uniref:tripartite motif-containing protein 16-like isoform X2 n=1 Tax=Erpetoichthys calabaricus TaxID=27687 RepID=UPI0022344FF8|nr:tripartite motif-containing protein 16-like isoform X2 [Erpetoichthys calabaricus]
MAVTPLSLFVDRYTCAVCLDVLKEPVTIPCGHSYCVKCIDHYWRQLDTWRVYRCPECRRSFDRRPELNRNTTLADLLERLKGVKVDVSPSQSYAGPDDVPCDVCPGRKRKASKTCLTCLVSYCETHLQPHKELQAFKKHKVEALSGNLKEKLCRKHHRILEIYCRTDKTCVCSLCAATEHKSHDTVTPDRERARRQIRMERRKSEMEKRIEEKEKKLKEMKEMVRGIQRSAEREMRKHEEMLKSVLRSIERLRLEVTNLIGDHKRKEERKAEDVIRQLEKEIKELRRRDAEMAVLLQTDDHIHFLQRFPSLCVPVEDGGVPALTINRDFLPTTLKTSLSDLNKNLEDIRDWKFLKSRETSVVGWVSSDVNCVDHNLDSLTSRSHFLKYSCPLSLDPNTAHRCLHVFEGNKKVMDKRTVTPYPNHPDRFGFWPQVLCSEVPSGTRCYWEVEWTGKWADIGVACKGMERKGWGKECGLGRNDKSWMLSCSHSSYVVCHNNMKTEIGALCTHRIGIYLDLPAGFLSFYSVSFTMTLLHRFKISFTEPLCLGFGLGLDSSVTICHLNPYDQ